MDAKQIRKDRLRYTKNTLSSRLAILAILFNVFFFVSIYKSDVSGQVGNYYYTWLVGVSIVYNLLFMMAAFLCSEGVKNYHFGYSVALLVIGALQFGRILIYPMKASKATVDVTVVKEDVESVVTYQVMTKGQFTFVLTCLLISGALCIIAGIIGIVKNTVLNAYMKEIGVAER